MSDLNEWLDRRRWVVDGGRNVLLPKANDDRKLLVAVERVLELHVPVPEAVLGYTESGYGEIDPACGACGTYDEFATPWPCATVRAIEGAIEGAINE